MSHKVSKGLIIKSVMLGTTGLSSAPRSALPRSQDAQTVFAHVHDKIAEQKRRTPLFMTLAEGVFDGGVLAATGSLGMFIAGKITETTASSLILGWVYPLHKKGNWWWQNSIVGASQLLGIVLLALLTRTDTYERTSLAVILLIAQFCNPLYNPWTNIALANNCDVSSDPSNPSATLVDCGGIWNDSAFLVRALIPQFVAFIVLIVLILHRDAQRHVVCAEFSLPLANLQAVNRTLRAELARLKGELAKLKESPSNPTSPTAASSGLGTIPAETSPKAPSVEISDASTEPTKVTQLEATPLVLGNSETNI